MTKAAEKAVAEGAAVAVARSLAVKAGIKYLAVNAVVSGTVGVVVPRLLRSAGLDDNEIRIGLSVLNSLQAIGTWRYANRGAGPVGKPAPRRFHVSQLRRRRSSRRACPAAPADPRAPQPPRPPVGS